MGRVVLLTFIPEKRLFLAIIKFYGLLSMRKSYRYLLAAGCADKLMVNCKSGLGRTGTFVQLLLMLDALDKGELKPDNAFTWFIESISVSRRNRGFNQFVQSGAPFEMLLQCLVNLTQVDEKQILSAVNQWAVERGWLLESN